MFKNAFAGVREAFKPKLPNLNASVTAVVSLAKQENEVANARLKDALCKVLDGPNCECRGLKVVNN